MVELTELEAEGLAIYEGQAMCNACHPSELGDNGELPLFTDFTYEYPLVCGDVFSSCAPGSVGSVRSGMEADR